VTLAVIGILYGALVAWVQTDMKKLVAYSSIAHLGFVMLGCSPATCVAWQGALLQMVNHGLSTGALFLLVGMLYDRRHTKKFEDFGGLAKVMPRVRLLPGLLDAGLGRAAGPERLRRRVPDPRSAARRTSSWPVALATFGVVLAAVYLLKML
jgi:NADH-quinone oxidoreductase subunit M